MPRYIGKEMSRVDGVAKVTGRAKYAAEFRAPNLAYGFIVLGTAARGTIKEIDMREAERAPGVVRVFTHLNAPKLGPKASTEEAPPRPTKERDKSFRALQSDRIFFKGQPVALFVFGAGHDALPVVELARDLGWQTEVVDPQARPASLARFSRADKVTLARPEEVGGRIRITPRTHALLMSHNYAHDLALLRFLLDSPARYIGVMGPRKRTERMLRGLAEGDDSFRPEESDRSRLYAPAGLDIGANAPPEVALSIIAEMRAFLAGRRGGMLRERDGSIHGSAVDGERLHVQESGAHPFAAA